MPRWRNCDSTMETRCDRNGSSVLRACSLLALADMNVKADDSVLIAHGHHGDIFINVVFQLDHSLRRLREAGDVGESDVVVDLLLDGDPRAGVIFRADELWIDLDAAGAGKPLHAVTEGRIQGLTQDRVGSSGCIT